MGDGEEEDGEGGDEEVGEGGGLRAVDVADGVDVRQDADGVLGHVDDGLRVLAGALRKRESG